VEVRQRQNIQPVSSAESWRDIRSQNRQGPGHDEKPAELERSATMAPVHKTDAYEIKKMGRINDPAFLIGSSGRLEYPKHLIYIRQQQCVLAGKDKCEGRTEAAHVRKGTDGGIGMKPSDRYVIPLCSRHHRLQHSIGEKAFEIRFKINMRRLADFFWRGKPA